MKMLFCELGDISINPYQAGMAVAAMARYQSSK
jgi:hypothetical protein